MNNKHIWWAIIVLGVGQLLLGLSLNFYIGSFRKFEESYSRDYLEFSRSLHEVDSTASTAKWRIENLQEDVLLLETKVFPKKHYAE